MREYVDARVYLVRYYSPIIVGVVLKQLVILSDEGGSSRTDPRSAEASQSARSGHI